MKRLLSAVFAVSLLTGAVAVAHADDHRRDWNRDHELNRGHEWNRHDDRNRHHSYAWRDTPRHYRVEPYRWPSGYRHYGWSRGDRLPVVYRAPHYVVYDYGRYGLYAPPRGCRWVRVGNDVVLTAITTGIVVNVVSDLFY